MTPIPTTAVVERDAQDLRAVVTSEDELRRAVDEQHERGEQPGHHGLGDLHAEPFVQVRGRQRRAPKRSP